MSAIKGKIACITGGINGIGFEIAKALMKKGLKGLVIADIDDSNVRWAIQELDEQGDGEIYFHKADLCSRYRVECVLKTTVGTFGNLDIVINNAGVISEDDYERMVQINYISMFYGTLLAVFRYLPKHKSGDSGYVINTAGVFGIDPTPCMPIYSACNGAVITMGRSLGTKYYFKRTQSKVLTLCPSLTNTRLIAKENLKGVDVKCFVEELGGVVVQEPECCGKCVVKMLTEGENGSVWVSEAGEYYPYPFRDYADVREEMTSKGKCADLLKKKKK